MRARVREASTSGRGREKRSALAENLRVLPHFRCSSRPGDQGKALRCLALPTSRTALVSNRQQARNRPRTSFSLNGITVLVLLYLHRKCGRTEKLAKAAIEPGATVVSDGLSCWPAVEKAGC